MKCAEQYEVLKAMAELAYEVEQRRLDEKAKEDFAKLQKETIDFCDTTLDKFFTTQVENRKCPHFEKKVAFVNDRLGNKMLVFIEFDGQRYANGEFSYKATGKKLAFDIFKAYLNQHCFSVDTSNEDYYRTYGFGRQECRLLIIKPF